MSSPTIAIDLPLEPASARRAREHLETFREALNESAFFDLRLLVTELIVEALKTEPEPGEDRSVELRAEFHGGRIRVELTDGGEAFRPPPRNPEPGETGWGVYLVARLSSDWGVRHERERSSVWLEVA